MLLVAQWRLPRVRDVFSPRSAGEQVDEKPGRLTHTGQGDIPYHRISHTLDKLGGIGHQGPISAQRRAIYLL